MDPKVQNNPSSENNLLFDKKDSANVLVTVLASNIAYPLGLKFGPDGALYISDTGFGPPTGKILKVAFSD